MFEAVVYSPPFAPRGEARNSWNNWKRAPTHASVTGEERMPCRKFAPAGGRGVPFGSQASRAFLVAPLRRKAPSRIPQMLNCATSVEGIIEIFAIMQTKNQEDAIMKKLAKKNVMRSESVESFSPLCACPCMGILIAVLSIAIASAV